MLEYGSSAHGGSAHNNVVSAERSGTANLSGFLFRAGPESAFQRIGNQP